MVSRQYTKLAMLMPLAMITGTLISIYSYKQAQQGTSIVITLGIALLIILLFYTYRKTQRKKLG